jgi:hypothetical protein
MFRFGTRLRRHRWLTLATFLLACGSLVDPPLPSNTVPMTAPAAYSAWWSMVESCSGITRPMSAVRWYQVLGADSFRDYQGRDLAGYWSPASNEIVLASGEVLDGGVVRHEMLHSIARTARHTRAEFLDKCEGIVDCDQACVADAEPLPPFSGRPLPSDSIEVGYRVDPTSPAASLNDGVFTITVLATNPTSDSVTAVLNPRGPSGFSFGAMLNSPRGGIGLQISFDDSSLVRFAPHQTKQAAFDFRIGADSSAQGLVPGTYGASVAYGTKRIFQTIELRP